MFLHVDFYMSFFSSTSDQPADDSWAGLCSKVICDHLGLGCKTGLPYVWNADKPKPVGNMQRDSKAVMWQVSVRIRAASSQALMYRFSMPHVSG